LLTTDASGDADVINATYLLTSPDGAWNADDNGRYEVRVERRSVRDTLGNSAGRRIIGGFIVQVPPPTPAAATASAATRTAAVSRPYTSVMRTQDKDKDHDDDITDDAVPLP
jgi:hypothetical protein